MAITGTGTQADPYVIDTYADWEAIGTGQNTYWTQGNDFWMQLNADLDCTGITWKDLKGTNIPKLHFDLNGHSITNVIVNNACTYGFFIGMELYNGSISLTGYDLYEQLFRYSYSYNVALELHHLNIEILDVTWIPEPYGYDFYYQSPMVISSANIRYCNITATVHFPDETQYRYGSNANGYFFVAGGTLEYTDFNLQIYGNYEYYYRNEHAPSRYPVFYNCVTIQYCRVRETLHNSIVSLTGVLARRTSFDYCVIEVDYSEAVIPADVNYGDATLIYADDTPDSTTTIMHVTYPAGETHYTIGEGVTPLTESEIRHYADITAVNFPITRTGEAQPTGYRWWITDGTLPYLDSFIPEPTPPTPGGDKPVYRYHTDTGWVKEGSIYIRTNGAWSAGSSGPPPVVLDAWDSKTWTGLTSFYGTNVWTDGTDIYYSANTTQYVLNKSTSTWSTKTWLGRNTISGKRVWTDNYNIYCSEGRNAQYVLNKSTGEWLTKTWLGYDSVYGEHIWKDDTNIYYSRNEYQYVLDKSTDTWVQKSWSGLSTFNGDYVWTDGTNIYFSDASEQYVLNKSTSTWVQKTWTGLSSFDGNGIWTDGTYIYYSNSSAQYVLDKSTSTWSQKSWEGTSSFHGANIWTDGTTYYCSNYAQQYYATGHVIPGPVQELKIHERVNNAWQDK